jgi:calcium-dependent protein kinase
MLSYDPKERISAPESLNDVWIQKNAPSTPLNPKCLSNLSEFNVSFCFLLKNLFILLRKNVKQLLFQARNKLKAAILTFIATQIISQHDKEKLMKAFQALDSDNDGILSREELIDG